MNEHLQRLNDRMRAWETLIDNGVSIDVVNAAIAMQNAKDEAEQKGTEA